MIKSELVQRIATQNPHLYQRDVENIVNAILDEITAAHGARRPGRAARLRRLLGEEPAGPHRPQPAHRRACLGREEERAVLQDRQGNARAAESRQRWLTTLSRVMWATAASTVDGRQELRDDPQDRHGRCSRSACVIVIASRSPTGRPSRSRSIRSMPPAGLRGLAAAVRADLRPGDPRRDGRRHRRLAAAGALAPGGAARGEGKSRACGCELDGSRHDLAAQPPRPAVRRLCRASPRRRCARPRD